MKNGKTRGKFVEKLMKLKRLKVIISFLAPIIGIVLILGLCIIIVMTVFERVQPVFTTSSIVGVETIYDDTDLVADLNTSLESWSDEEKYIFEELKRQKNIWEDDYKIYGISHNPGNPFLVIDNFQTNELDLVEQVVPIQFQGAINLYSFDLDFTSSNEVIKPDGTMSNDYEGEDLVNNRDTKDFYVQAATRIGNTFFFYPRSREMLGNFIGAEITFDAIRPVYKIDEDCNVTVLNLALILSDWSILGKMSLEDDAAYEAYIEQDVKGPYDSAGDFVIALGDGFDDCLINIPEDKNDWTWLNVCNDYKLLYEETQYLDDYNNRVDSVNELQSIIRDAVSEMSPLKNASIPIWEVSATRGLIEQNIIDYDYVTQCDTVISPPIYFITVTVDRFEDDELYEKYMKEIYIPHLYINCESCAYKDASETEKERKVNSIYNEIQQLEQAYRYYNGDGITEIDNGVITGGTADVEGTDYTCDSGAMPNLATYPGHKGVDINGVPVGTNVYPLFEGTVTEIKEYNSNCYPQGNDTTGYTCSHCGANGFGNKVVVTGVAADGIEYRAIYAHLNEINVTYGQQVTMDTVIGTVGNTGCSTGAHLHLELRRTDNNGVVYATQIYNNNAVQSVLCSRN